MAEVIFGSARIDENSKISGGAVGDQTGNEVSTQPYYMHKKGWYVLRPKSDNVANILAIAMLQACNNNNIGYDQNNRDGVVKLVNKCGSLDNISEKTESDCSSLVRACCIQSGFDPGNFNTSSQASVLENSGQFNKRFELKSADELYVGDVLVTKTKGHTVIVVNGKDRVSENVDLADVQKALKMALNIIPNTYGYTMSDVQAMLKKALKITDTEPNKSGNTELPTSTVQYKQGATYTLVADALRVRKSPNGQILTYNQLSANAKKNAYPSGTLKKGTRVTCKDLYVDGNTIWMEIPSGWICAVNNGKVYVS